MRAVIYSIAFLMLTTQIALADEPPTPAVVSSQVIVALDIRDLDVKDAVKLIAQKSGLNIVSGDSVQGRVTLYLENIPAKDALAMVLQMAHAAFEDNGGVIQVITGQEYETKYGRPFSQRVIQRLLHLKGMKATAAATLIERFRNQFGKVIPDDASGTLYIEDMPVKVAEIEQYLREVDLAVETRIYSLNYLEAEAAAAKLNSFLTNGVGNIKPDKQSNKIFITDVPAKLDEIEKFLKVADVPRKPFVFALNYAKADDVSAVLKQYLTPNLGTLEINKRSNQVIVVDTEAKIKEIGEVIKQFDHKEQEVLIEARIVQVTLSDTYKMGIDWDSIVKNTHGLEMKTNWGGVGSDAKGSLAIGTLSDDNYHAVVEALGKAGKSHILSNPRIAVLNNEEAKILVGTTKPYVTSTTTTPTSGPVTVSEDIKFIDVGVKLLVTPTIHPDGFVTMKIRPEVSSTGIPLKTGSGNEIPVIDTSEVDTTVRVKDGVTVVIGGLIKEDRTNQDSKVPFLGDIPVVGHAFKNTSRTKDKTEIVIFLTPKIMTGDVK
ncbi:MAG: type II secretion system protein GspD [Candidatus Omnitrophica bacterium]|nr:type II secretion system protein GspD [Candidatus Omnitrophota bacterium]